MRLSLPTLLAVLTLAASTPAAGAESFVDTTPGTQAFAVPAGVNSMTVVATGGAGGDLVNGSGTILVPGGRAASITALVTVFPGEQLQLTVASGGGSGNVTSGTSGGAGKPDGGAGGSIAGGGGGATRVLACEGVTCPVAIIAAGGGGAGGTGYIASGSFPALSGGPGGAAGAAGGDGASDNKVVGGSGGQPGTAASPGTGGPGFEAGKNGSGPAGGAGGALGTFGTTKGGGGGGGGVFGGGGGGSGNFGEDASLDQAYAGGGGGGGGSSLVPGGASMSLAAPGTAPGIVLTWTPPAGPGPGQGGGLAVSGLKLSPSAFPAAPSGPSAIASAKRRFGAKVAYTLSTAADVRFTVDRKRRGRRATLRGSFTRPGAAGANSFRFSGRLGGRELKPGRYRLIATPRTDGKAGQAAIAPFRVVG